MQNNNTAQRRGIVNALEYSLKSLNDLKKEMLTVDSKKQDAAWTIGSFIIVLTSHMIHSAQETIQESMQNGDSNAKQDLETIKQKMIALIDQMIAGKQLAEDETK